MPFLVEVEGLERAKMAEIRERDGEEEQEG
jgi:hypothetical protein